VGEGGREGRVRHPELITPNLDFNLDMSHDLDIDLDLSRMIDCTTVGAIFSYYCKSTL